MQDNFIKVFASYNMGDLISALAGLRKVCNDTGKKAVIYQRLNLPMNSYFQGHIHPTVDENGQAVGMNRAMFDMLKPLLEAQPYIESFNIFNGESGLDYDLEKARMDRLLPLPAGSIHTWNWFMYPEMTCDLGEAWIEVPRGTDEEWLYGASISNIEKLGIRLPIICVSRTERYTNPYITYNFLKKYQHLVVFLGTVNEFELFKDKWDLPDIEYAKVDNFLMLAKIMKYCRMFMGNASMPYHLSEAMKVPRILEYCREFPNSSPNGKDGYQFLHQEALLKIFNKLLNG